MGSIWKLPELEMIIITLDLRLLTPAFLGGGGPTAELRPPAFKGLLRFWHRAIDPRFFDRERTLFGGTGDGVGQSRVLLRVDEPTFTPMRWDRARAQRFSEGQGKFAKNGLVYLGYPFQLKSNLDRTALPADTEVRLRCVIPRPIREADDRRALLAALWAFATCGALGMRSRRGFGSLAFAGWKAEGSLADLWKEDMARLPVLSGAADRGAWMKSFDTGRATLRQWIGSFGGRPKHPHMGDGTTAQLSPTPFKDWEGALNHAGRQLQDFRQRLQPDYDRVKDHLRFRSREGGVKLRAAPERTAFGLPLAFRYSSLQGRVTQTIIVPHGHQEAEQGKPLERHPSPLLLKLVRLPDGLHALWLRLDGPRPGTEPPAAERNTAQPLSPPTRDLVGEFLLSTLDPKKH